MTHSVEHALTPHQGALCTATFRLRPHSARVLDALGEELSRGERPATLVPGVSLYDLWSTDDGHAMLVSVDDDWSDRAPLGPEDHLVPAYALLPLLDIAERCGVGSGWWQMEGIPDRNQLMLAPALAWEDVRHVFNTLGDLVGTLRFRRGCRDLAELTSDVSRMGPQDILGVVRFVHEVVMGEIWRPLISYVLPLRPGVTCIRMSVRAGLGGCPAMFAAHAGTLESMPRHLGLPFGRVTRALVEGDGVRATFVMEHGSDAAELPTESVQACPPRLNAEGLLRSRLVAREHAADQLGTNLSKLSSIHELVDVFFDGLFDVLDIRKLSLDLVSHSGEARPFRTRGSDDAGDVDTEAPMHRVLRHGERAVAHLTIHASVSSSAELLAVLDLVQPWLAAGIGVGLETARLRHQRDAVDAEARALLVALDRALERLKRAAFVMEHDGRVSPKNAAARELGKSKVALAEWVSTALGSQDDYHDRVLLPREHGGMLLVQRSPSRSLDDGFNQIAQEAGLSPRRREVARMTLAGKSVDQVADALGIREGTVRAHLTSVYRALGVDGHVGFLVRCLTNDHVGGP